MAGRTRQWVYVGARAGKKPSDHETQTTAAACERLITEVLTPKFLPVIRPGVEFNYPIRIHGKWHGNRYRFMTRYRSETPQSMVAEFDAPFARLGYLRPDRFEVDWHRHTGEWFCVMQDASLAEALDLIGSDGIFHPC